MPWAEIKLFATRRRLSLGRVEDLSPVQLEQLNCTRKPTTGLESRPLGCPPAHPLLSQQGRTTLYDAYFGVSNVIMLLSRTRELYPVCMCVLQMVKLTILGGHTLFPTLANLQRTNNVFLYEKSTACLALCFELPCHTLSTTILVHLLLPHL